MLTLKFLKTGNARFISHLEMLRQSSRILRRAGVDVKFSQGFNPHALIFFSPPGVLGTASLAEYISIDTQMTGEEVFERYNRSVSEDIKAIEYFETPLNPNLAGKVTAADYVFPTSCFPLEKDFIITYDKKCETLTENAGDKIFSIFDADGKLGLRLASGNTNLRPDRVILGLKQNYGLDVSLVDTVKTAQYASGVPADEFLLKLAKTNIEEQIEK